MKRKASAPCCPKNSEKNIQAVKDTLHILSGRWKIPLIIVLGNDVARFNEIQRTLGDITSKTLAKELRELELNELVIREVVATRPVTVHYKLAPYCLTLAGVLNGLCDWGLQHRQRIMQKPGSG